MGLTTGLLCLLCLIIGFGIGFYFSPHLMKDIFSGIIFKSTESALKKVAEDQQEEEKKKAVFLAPAVGVVYTVAYEASNWGITTEIAEGMNMLSKLENTYRVYQEVRKRGIRALPGGDYGFAFNPIGTNARDLEHFVNLFGYSPAEALIAATKWGGELMGMNLGQIKEGYLADILLVNGDPTQDVSILQDRDNLLAIIKDGSFYKAPDADALAARRQVSAPAAAE